MCSYIIHIVLCACIFNLHIWHQAVGPILCLPFATGLVFKRHVKVARLPACCSDNNTYIWSAPFYYSPNPCPAQAWTNGFCRQFAQPGSPSSGEALPCLLQSPCSVPSQSTMLTSVWAETTGSSAESAEMGALTAWLQNPVFCFHLYPIASHYVSKMITTATHGIVRRLNEKSMKSAKNRCLVQIKCYLCIL